MFVVRPVEPADLAELEALASQVTSGVHTLPRTRATIARAIERSMASFLSDPGRPVDEFYLFVLESGADTTLAGTAAIAATAGARGAYFAFRREVLNQVSRDLDISHDVQALMLCSDLTHCSQLSGFCLREEFSRRPLAGLLSRSRLLYSGLAPRRFSERLFAAMAGINDDQGRSPFWDALGRKFFRMEFLEAERLIEGTRNSTLIVELMPHYPVYVPLLPHEAQEAMGQVHDQGRMPFDVLCDEGFLPNKYIDIFDGGPILEAERDYVHSASQTVRRSVANSVFEDDARPTHLVANTCEERFRVVLTGCLLSEASDVVSLPQEARRLLQVMPGDPVMCLRL